MRLFWSGRGPHGRRCRRPGPARWRQAVSRCPAHCGTGNRVDAAPRYGVLRDGPCQARFVSRGRSRVTRGSRSRRGRAPASPCGARCGLPLTPPGSGDPVDRPGTFALLDVWMVAAFAANGLGLGASSPHCLGRCGLRFAWYCLARPCAPAASAPRAEWPYRRCMGMAPSALRAGRCHPCCIPNGVIHALTRRTTWLSSTGRI